MAKHRRYPQKKRNNASRSGTIQNKKGLNLEPSRAMLDDEQMSRKIKELKQLSATVPELENVKRKRRPRNRFLEETAKMGYAQRPWESEDLLLSRINRDTHKSVDEQLLKAKFGMAGRSIKDIAGDYKELDEKERRRKLQKLARKEKERKLHEKELAFKANKKRMRQMKKQQNDVNSDDDSLAEKMDELQERLETEESDNEEDKQENLSDGSEESASSDEVVEKEKHKTNKPNEVKKSRRLGKNDKLRLKRKQEREENDKDFLLNAREIIPFGERADAPPEFSGKLRREMDPLFAHAGRKDLLLKKQLAKAPEGDVKLSKRTDSSDLFARSGTASVTKRRSKIAVDPKEREKIIQAYRRRPK
ncbi:hypothetical protein Ddc_02827 [Ditylenchus destructor]|nr:hypothetical protein Ddc_02827 [Ditylenchus destructor]